MFLLFINELPKLDLPAEIKAIYVFGSILRDKEEPKDLDAIFLYSQTPEQKERWEKFRKNFATYDLHDSSRFPLREIKEHLLPFYHKGTLAEAVKDKELSKVLIAREIPPEWAGCFSWSEIFHNPHGFFIPYIERVLRRLLLKGKRGFRDVAFVQYNDFIQGKSSFSHLHLVLAWSPEKLNVYSNILERPYDEKRGLILKEIESSLARISELKKQYIELKQSLQQTLLKLKFSPLEQTHSLISPIGKESYAELKTLSEQARAEEEKYQEEIKVLSTIKGVLPPPQELYSLYSIEEAVACLVLIHQPKYEIHRSKKE